MQQNSFGNKVSFLKRFPVFVFFSIFVTAIYWNGIYGNFVWDDRTYFIDNDILPNLNPWDIKEIFPKPSNYWGELLPVRDFLYVLEYNLFGPNPVGYHLVSIGLYVLICFFVYLFLRSFYSSAIPLIPPLAKGGWGDLKEGGEGGLLNCHCEAQGAKAISSDVSAFFVTLLFAVYPVHVECVAYISAQKDLLYSLFSLLSIYTFYRFLNFQKRRNLLALGILFYYLALLSKLTAIALAVFIPLLYLLSDRSKKPEIKRSLVVWVFVNIPVILWILKSIDISKSYLRRSFEVLSLPLFERIIRSLKILGAHTAISIKPYPLSFGHPFDSSTSLDANLLSGIIAIIVIVSLILYFRKDHSIILGSFVFILFLFPVLQLGSIAGYYIYDKYLFIPVLGIVIIIERFLRLFPLALNRLRIIYLSVIFCVILVFSAITISYIPTFKDDIASTRNSYEKFPDWPSSSFNYVYSLIEGGRLDEAWDITVREKSFSSPPWVRSYFKGWIYLQQGKLDQAVSTLSYSSILAVSEGYFPFPSIPLGRALMASGRYKEAEQEFKKVLSSELYNPLEVYHARKELEKIRQRED